MWVETQNGKQLTNLVNVKKLEVAVKYTHRRNAPQDSVPDGYSVRTEDMLLGVYPTEEAALRALAYVKREIHEHEYDLGYLTRMPNLIDLARMPKHEKTEGSKT